LVTAAIGITALICIFLYKNRKLQLRLTVLCIALEALLIFLYYMQVKTFTGGTYALTALLQGCIVFFLFLAARGINHDSKIIRESNRLR
jgi:peptidoglycan/LPS O-acetylase OafA/YrhL